MGIKKTGLLIGLIFIMLIPSVFAQSEENFFTASLDLFGMVISIIIVIITLSTISKLSGDLRKNWIYITIAMVFFAISGLSVGLDDITSIPNLEFIGDLTELIFIIIMLLFVYNLKYLFNNISNKK
jgi:hypothetical protein